MFGRQDKETGTLSETRDSTSARHQRHAKAVVGVGKNKKTGTLSETNNPPQCTPSKMCQGVGKENQTVLLKTRDYI